MNERKTTVRRAAYWPVLAALVLATAFGAVLPAVAQTQDDLPGRVGRVADVGGELFLAPQDKPDAWAPIALNYPVTNGDNLWVGNDGRAEIDFGGGQFRLAGDTNLHVSRLDDRQFALFVAQGRVSLRVRVLDPGEAAQIDTPNAQIAITRPGLYRVDVSEDRQRSQLVVREGEANVYTQGTVQQVLPGQTADIEGTDPRFATVRNGIGTDGFDTWVASRDRRYIASRTSNYVSPQMVGAADLDQYGTWQQVPDQGAVWYPNDVPGDWAPYRNGYWADVGTWGPTWVDYAPWGYAPFHYGRWSYIGGRWGWLPGRYVARPLWAPALVAWTGGAGWNVSVGLGGPVYGWVPLAWGEPYRPWWGRCSYGCWDRYNRPYNVNVTVVRPNSPPPTRYVNFNSPNGVTAVSGTAFMAGRPVQQNLVRVSRDTLASAPPPVMASPPPVRNDTARVMGRRPDSAPPPASTFQPTTARPALPASQGTMMGGRTPAGDPGLARTRPSTTQPAQPSAMGRTLPSTPSTTASVPPTQPSLQPSQRTPQPTASTAPMMRQPQPQSPQMNAPQPVPQESRSFNRTMPAQPQPQAPAFQPSNPPQSQANTNRSSRQQSTPPPVQTAPPARTAPQPMPQQQPQAQAPMGRGAPQQPQVQAPVSRGAPQQPPQAQAPVSRAAPQPAPQPTPQPQQRQGNDGRSDGNRGGSDNPGGNAQRSQR